MAHYAYTPSNHQTIARVWLRCPDPDCDMRWMAAGPDLCLCGRLGVTEHAIAETGLRDGRRGTKRWTYDPDVAESLSAPA
ncbi:MAG: hypothetical protein ACRDQA_16085 [Nocardioidaceae bacterium]